jgi:DNA-binding transcriptional LysR family regulator
MTLTQLRYLVAIVDANLNISLAATQLNTTQPGMSKQLRHIEDELGFQVFVRKGKSLVQLTEDGVRVLAHARSALREVQNIRTIAADHRGEARGQLRVATSQTLGRFVLTFALAQLKSRFPGVAVGLKSAGEVDALALLERDQADLAIISTEGDRPAGDVVLPLFRYRRVLIAKRDHPLALRPHPIGLADLAEVPLVTYESATTSNFKLGRAFHAQGVQPNIACTARDADTIKTCVRLGLGIGLIPEMAIEASDADLTIVGTAEIFPECVSWAVMQRERVRHDYVIEFLRLLAPSMSRDEIQSAMEGMGELRLENTPSDWREIATLRDS